MTAFLWTVSIAGGFLSGSVMYSKLIPALILKKDICAVSEDKNPGAYNAFKHCGKKVGALCLALDLLKGFIPVFLACFFLDSQSLLFALVIVAPVAGHAVGMFNGFHGGKCILTSFAVMLALIPVTPVCFATLAVLYIVFTVLIKISPNGKKSIAVFALFALITCSFCGFMNMAPLAVGCGAVALTVILKHIRFKAEERESEETVRTEQ